MISSNRFYPVLYPCLFVTLLLAFYGCSHEPSTDPIGEGKAVTSLFTLLPPEQTGIDFVNRLTEGPNTNIFVYEYFYNGGGVGAGDLNGDGTTDLYFSANMSPNQLYLNDGDWQFRDVTRASGAAGREGPWTTGVSLADVNGDGRLDIHLSYSGMLPPDKRRNQLFINQGNDADGVPQFRDEAAAYGLDNPSFTNQVYFFDYDGDGDLDCLQLNHNPKSLPILNLPQTKQLLATPDRERGLRLFRRDGDRFVDVTEAAGINGSALSYGLGLAISDLDRDGDPDFYVSNDYEVPDYLYYNNGDGTFTDRLADGMGQSSHFSMGSDVADVNNDGWPDLYTLDMLPPDNLRRKLLTADDNRSKMDLNLASGFHYQSMRNMLHLNQGGGDFAEVGQLAGINATDWSWSALFADYDNDGRQDLHVTNGYLRDYTDQDFIKYMNDFVAARGRLQRADLRELIENMPASNVSNRAFRNRGGVEFTEVTTDWGLERPSNSNGAAYADLDGDGDLDLVVNNLNQAAFVYRNEATANNDNHYLSVRLEAAPAIGSRVDVKIGALTLTRELYPNRGYQSSVEPLLHFGLGEVATVDELTVTWPDGTRNVKRAVPADQLVTLTRGDNEGTTLPARPKPVFQPVASPVALTDKEENVRDFDRQSLLPKERSHYAIRLAVADFDGDGREDIVSGGAENGGLQLWRQVREGRFSPRDFGTRNAANTVTSLAAGDWNGDGAVDLYVGYGGYRDYGDQDEIFQDEVYLNDGSGGFTGTSSPLSDSPTEVVAAATSAPLLFVGGGVIPGAYPRSAASHILEADPNGTFGVLHTFPSAFTDLGPVSCATWYDLDGDGRDELIVAGEYRPIQVFSHNGESIAEVTETYFSDSPRGWWNALYVSDLNGDGHPDLVAGNRGLNNIFRAAPEAPVELHAADLDDNGSIDPLLSYYVDGKRQLDATRDELLGQLSGLRGRFTNYRSYAEADFDEAIPEWPTGTLRLAANELQTLLFLGQPDGTFRRATLPPEAQYAPVHVITRLDHNADGHPDLLLCGNESRGKQRFGKVTANAGVLLEGDGRGGFRYVPQSASGFRLKGDVREVTTLGDLLLFSIRDRGVVAYRKE